MCGRIVPGCRSAFCHAFQGCMHLSLAVQGSFHGFTKPAPIGTWYRSKQRPCRLLMQFQALQPACNGVHLAQGSRAPDVAPVAKAVGWSWRSCACHLTSWSKVLLSRRNIPALPTASASRVDAIAHLLQRLHNPALHSESMLHYLRLLNLQQPQRIFAQ